MNINELINVCNVDSEQHYVDSEQQLYCPLVDVCMRRQCTAALVTAQICFHIQLYEKKKSLG